MFMKSIKTSLTRKLAAGFCMVIAGGIGWAQLSTAPAAAPAAEPNLPGTPPTMRRLTELQYRAIIADVFAPDVPIAGRFERARREEGLVAIGTAQGGMSPFSLEQYDASARSIAAAVTGEKRRAQFVPCQPKSDAAFDKGCATRFVELYGLKLFRRPLSAAERTRYVQIARSAQQRLGGFHQGLEYALAGMLVSPEFLLRIENTEHDPRAPGGLRLDAWSKAARLSFFLTNSTPDAELLRAASAGELHTDAGLARQVDRLIASPQLEAAVRAFFWDMLHFDGFGDLFKDPAIYPAYTTDVARDAQEQTLRTIVTHLITDRGDYRDLFTTNKTWLSRPLGIVYRMPVATRNGWEQGEFPASAQRSGILTDISLLALYSHPGRSSPTLRGKALRETFLCEKVPDPPANVSFSIVQDAVNRPGSTARLRLAEHNENPVCAGCHKLTDPLGLTLENFDGTGGFRARENGAELDLSGKLQGTDFTGPQGLGKTLRDNPGVPLCLVQKLYSSASGRPLATKEEPYVEYLLNGFAASGYRLPDLMRAIALSKTFYAVSEPPKPASPPRVAASNKGDRS